MKLQMNQSEDSQRWGPRDIRCLRVRGREGLPCDRTLTASATPSVVKALEEPRAAQVDTSRPACNSTVADELFTRMGNMSPSRSSLDRLPKQLSERWEEQRAAFEEELTCSRWSPTTRPSWRYLWTGC